MNVWIMNLKDNREESNSKTGDEKFQFCMSQGIVGIGWVGCDPETSEDGAYLRAHMSLNSFEIGDLVWVHNNVTDNYYACSITEKAKKTDEESFNQNDISEYCRCKFIGVGDSQTLPNGITPERLISRATISSAPDDIAIMTEQHFSFLKTNNTQSNDNKKGFSGIKEKILKLKIFKKPKLLISIVAVVLAVGIAAGVIIRNNIYYKNMSSTFTTIVSRNDTAESAGTLLGEVWYNTIMKISDEDTDPYTKSEYNGRYFNDDFNDSIKAFYGLTNGIDGDLDYRLCEFYADSNYIMKKIKNPPMKYKEAYKAVSNYYESVNSLIRFVTDKSGGYSYRSYIETYREKAEKADTDYEAAKKYFE